MGSGRRKSPGHDPDAEPKAFDAFCPLRRVTAQYPPTLFVHGTNDTDVPHEQSVLMDRELAHRGVPHELISVAGAGHGLGGVDRKVVAGIHDRVLAFLQAAHRVSHRHSRGIRPCPCLTRLSPPRSSAT